MEPDDWNLIRDWQGGAQEAFTQLVRRHLPLVLASARRQLPDPHLAEDVAQAVFLLLARKAPSLPSSTVLPGWLFNTTRLVVRHTLRSETRRRHRELLAAAMDPNPTSTPSPDPSWDRASAALDEALAQLGAADRDALLLRFTEGRNHREVGVALGIGESRGAVGGGGGAEGALDAMGSGGGVCHRCGGVAGHAFVQVDHPVGNAASCELHAPAPTGCRDRWRGARHERRAAGEHGSHHRLQQLGFQLGRSGALGGATGLCPFGLGREHGCHGAMDLRVDSARHQAVPDRAVPSGSCPCGDPCAPGDPVGPAALVAPRPAPADEPHGRGPFPGRGGGGYRGTTADGGSRVEPGLPHQRRDGCGRFVPVAADQTRAVQGQSLGARLRLSIRAHGTGSNPAAHRDAEGRAHPGAGGVSRRKSDRRGPFPSQRSGIGSGSELVLVVGCGRPCGMGFGAALGWVPVPCFRTGIPDEARGAVGRVGGGIRHRDGPIANGGIPGDGCRNRTSDPGLQGDPGSAKGWGFRPEHGAA